LMMVYRFLHSPRLRIWCKYDAVCKNLLLQHPPRDRPPLLLSSPTGPGKTPAEERVEREDGGKTTMLFGATEMIK